MAGLDDGRRAVRFGPFEYNPATGELIRGGRKIRLVGQPVQLLSLMLERPGEVVTRDEMRTRLWPGGTFVDFEHSLNSAIKKLRHALGDSAANPQFIETLARQGYRFIASVELVQIGEAGETVPPIPAGSQVTEETLAPRPEEHKASRTVVGLAVPGAIVAAVLVALAFTVLRRRHDHGPWRNSRLTLLIAGEGDLSDPAISSDGKMLAYVKAEAGTGRIYIRRLAGGSPLRLCPEDAREVEPAFAPDDERIAFTRYLPDSNRPQICIAPILGGEKPTCVVDDGRNPAWSPDGARLAFVLEPPGGGQALATSASDGAGVHIILRADGVYPFLHYPSWSADGRSIAFDRSIGGTHGEIWVIPANGGRAVKLEKAPPGVYLHHPLFAPDGKALIYSSNRSGARNLWRRSLEKTGADTQVTRGPGPEEWPSISKTGRLVFVKIESKDTLYVARLSTGGASRLLSHSPFLWAPSISPNGREVAFSQAEYNGSWHIWVMSLASGDLRPLTSGREPQIYGRFSSDGQWLTYFTWSPGASRIWRASLHGGPPEPLTPASEDAAYGDLSPDSRTLAFVRTSKGLPEIWLMPVAGGTERQLIRSPSTVPRWSPDGNWIAFSPDRSLEGGIFIARSDGSGTRRLTNSGGWPVWLPDGRQIAFRTHRPDGTQRVEVVTLKNDRVTPFGHIHFSGDNDPFDFSPDGKSIIYTNGETFSSEIWLLDTRR